MKCIVLAAGYATRLYPLTENFPKPLLEVKGKTILDWLLDDIDESKEVDEYIIISNHKFINHFNKWANEKELSAKITVIDDGTISNETRLGAVADINLALESLNINDDTMVIAGDNVLDFSLNTFIDYFKSNGNNTSIMRYYEPRTEKIKKSANVTFDETDKVTCMLEKPQEPKSNWCVPPFYIYSKKDIPMVKKAIESGCNIDAPGSFISWLYDKNPIYTMEMPGKRYDIGNLESYNDVGTNYPGIQKNKVK